jgi:hypothetical protein
MSGVPITKDREFVCGDCYRAFLYQGSWVAGEKAPCPFCKSRETTPLLETHIGATRLRHYSFSFRPKEDRWPDAS